MPEASVRATGSGGPEPTREKPAGASGEMAWATPSRAPQNVRCRTLPAGHCRSAPVSSTAMKAFCGMSTLPTLFIRFLPSFCFAHSFFLREMSPP